MTKTVILITVIIILFFNTPSNAADKDIVINEIMPNPSGSSSEPNEFIELYNNGSESVTITAWELSDAVGKTYTIPDQTIGPGEFVFFRRETTKIALNNSGDDVKVVDASGTTIDSLSYNSSIEDRSISRVPNGTGNFSENTKPTEGKENSSPPPSPSPTPKDSSTTTSSTSSTKASPSPSPTTNIPNNSSVNNSSVLGEQQTTAQSSPIIKISTSPSPSPEIDVDESPSQIKVAGVLAGAGAILIGSTLIFYLWYNKVKNKNSSKQKP